MSSAWVGGLRVINSRSQLPSGPHSAWLPYLNPASLAGLASPPYLAHDVHHVRASKNVHVRIVWARQNLQYRELFCCHLVCICALEYLF